EECARIRERLEAGGARVSAARVSGRDVLICADARATLGEAAFDALRGLADVVPIPEPYKLASRRVRDATHVRVGGPRPTVVGATTLALIAGPCSVEGLPMLRGTARAVAAAGASMLRGGAFKPRTSPYAFQGLGVAALEMLSTVRAETGLPVVTEIMDARQLDAMLPHVDVFQVGARNMQNFSLLAALGDIRRPVLLKRGAAATIEELLLAAEHVLARGNGEVVLCERGVRAHETRTRNTLDVAAVPVLQRETHLPVIVDPSHAAGRADLVLPLSLAAVAAGADGLMIEVHPTPATALSDGDQSLTFDAFAALLRTLEPVATAVGRTLPASADTAVDSRLDTALVPRAAVATPARRENAIGRVA
ncbi:MAG: 3-deoxy-7-phosphoheptulonate synthase, partial [Longimicrobiales bacterium]